MIITTEEAERLARRMAFLKNAEVPNALPSLAAERDALKAKNARLREAIEMARYYIEDRYFVSASLTLAKALGEKE